MLSLNFGGGIYYESLSGQLVIYIKFYRSLVGCLAIM